MEFVIEKKELSALTTAVYRAASTRNTTPILSGLLIEATFDKGLTMTATDMEIGIKASNTNVEIIEEGKVLVNAHYFADYIKLLPDSKINVNLNYERSKLNITYGRSSGAINIYRDYEYPDLPISNMQKFVSLPQYILREALKKTVFASAVTHFRQVFTGILFDLKENGSLRIVASDTHRLAYYIYNLAEQNLKPLSFVIPSRTVSELLRLLDDNKEEITIGYSQNNVFFVKKDFLLLSRIIEGQYPNYDQVIPSSFNTTIIIQSQILEETLERARIMPTDDKLKIQHVQFSLGKDEVIINSYSDIMGEIKEVIENVTIEGQNEQRIAFNTNYFLDVVKLLSGECEEIVIKLSSSQGPAMILNPNKDNYLYILVPLRTSN